MFQLVKTVDLDPKKNYIFGFHPHGEKRTRLSVDLSISQVCWQLCDLSVCGPVCLSGVLVAGGFGNFCTEATGFSRLFPGLTSHLLMLPFWFRVPLFRDYIMCGGTPVCLCTPGVPILGNLITVSSSQSI